MSKTKVLTFVQKYTMIIALVLVTAFFAWRTNGKLLLPQNLTNIIAQNAYVFVLATGMLLCILTGGNIDLSVGSVVCFVGTVGAVLMRNDLNMWLVVLVMLLVGLLIGAWQAFWIAYVHVPPFITTLSGMMVFRGLSNVVLQGKTVSVTNEKFVQLFGGGAKCYVPDVFHGANINILCIVVGALCCISSSPSAAAPCARRPASRSIPRQRRSSRPSSSSRLSCSSPIAWPSTRASRWR